MFLDFLQMLGNVTYVLMMLFAFNNLPRPIFLLFAGVAVLLPPVIVWFIDEGWPTLQRLYMWQEFEAPLPLPPSPPSLPSALSEGLDGALVVGSAILESAKVDPGAAAAQALIALVGFFFSIAATKPEMAVTILCLWAFLSSAVFRVPRTATNAFAHMGSAHCSCLPMPKYASPITSKTLTEWSLLCRMLGA